jgi:hypothetical protein
MFDFRKRAGALIAAVFALGNTTGCAFLPKLIDLPPAVRTVCSEMTVETRSFDRVICEVDAGILEYEGLAVAADTLLDASLAAPDDTALETLAIALGKANAKASPAIELLKIARDEAVYFDDAAKADGNQITKAAQAFARLSAAWREAKPSVDALSTEWGLSKDKAPQLEGGPL